MPFGPFDPMRDATIEAGLRRWVDEQTPLKPGYVEQLYTFGNRGRYAGQRDEAARVVSVGYLALTHADDALPTAPRAGDKNAAVELATASKAKSTLFEVQDTFKNDSKYEVRGWRIHSANAQNAGGIDITTETIAIKAGNKTSVIKNGSESSRPPPCDKRKISPTAPPSRSATMKRMASSREERLGSLATAA